MENQDKEQIDEQKKSATVFTLSKYIRLAYKENKGAEEHISHKAVAGHLGISIQMLRQRLYGCKPVSRDFIIALCAACELSQEQTNIALNGCEYRELNVEYKRDNCLIQCFNKKAVVDGKEILSVDSINCELKKGNYEPLDMQHHSQRKKEKTSEFTIINDTVLRTFVDNLYSRYNSMSTEYLPEWSFQALVSVEDADKKRYTLIANSDSTFTVWPKSSCEPQIYRNISDTDRFKAQFQELYGEIQREQKRLELIFFDSKNFEGRFGANIVNDRIHVFYEEFNYSLPISDEYLLMEYKEGVYSLSISEKSMFMKEYLSRDEYIRHYGSDNKSPRYRFSSCDEIEALINDPKQKSFYVARYKNYLSSFNRLKEKVEAKLQEIRERQAFINDFDTIWDNPNDVLRYYRIENEFGCKYNEDVNEIFFAKSKALFTAPSGAVTEITFDDIKRAFELGFSDIEQIVRVKALTGSVESVLK